MLDWLTDAYLTHYCNCRCHAFVFGSYMLSKELDVMVGTSSGLDSPR